MSDSKQLQESAARAMSAPTAARSTEIDYDSLGFCRTISEEMREAERLGPIQRLFGPLLYNTDYLLLGGDDKAGKSTFAMNMALHIVSGTNMAPQLTNSFDGPITIGYLDWELSPPAMMERFKKFTDELGLDKQILFLRPDFTNPVWRDPRADRIELLINWFRSQILKHGIHILIGDNPMAFLPDVSSGPGWTRFSEGLKSIQQEVQNTGSWTTFALPMHITKTAQARRTQKQTFDNASQKADIRGGSGAASFAGSVVEIRRSSVDRDLLLLMVFDTRHDKLDFDNDSEAIAFRINYTPGLWRLEYEGLELIANHFGPHSGQDAAEQRKQAEYWEARVKFLHGKGMSNNQIRSTLQEEAKDKALQDGKKKQEVDKMPAPVGLRRISELIKGWGLKPNGKPFGA